MPSLPPTVKGYLFYDGVWNDVSNKMRQTSPITITRGADSEQGENSPTKAELVMDNRSGDFSPRNPESPLFDKIGRNTPMKVAIEAGPPYLLIPAQSLFDESALVAQDSAQMDFTGDVDLRIELSSDDFSVFDIGSALGFASRWEFTGSNRCWWWGRSQSGEMYFAWTEDGVLSSTGGSIESTEIIPFFNGERVAMRVTLDVDNGAGGFTTRFYYSNQIDGEWVQLGDDVVDTTSGSTFVFNGNGDADVWIGCCNEAIPQTGGSASMIDGKLYAFQMRQGIDGPLMIDFNAARDAEAGDTAIVDATGQAWALQEDATFSNEYVRIVGEVPSWPPNRDLSGNNKDVAIEPTGITRRLDSGNKPLESSLLRYLRAREEQPVECWPLTDGVQANGGANIVAGGQAAFVRIEDAASGEFLLANEQYEWATGTIAKWIEPVGIPTSDTNGNLTGECRDDATAANDWSLDMFVSAINDGSQGFQAIDRTVPTDVDFAAIWNIEIDKSADSIDLLFASVGESSSSISLLAHMLGTGIFDKQPHHLRLNVSPGASSSDWFFYVDGELIDFGTFGVGSVQLQRVRANWFLDINDSDGWPFGFLTYWGSNAPAVDEIYQAFIGFPGETSGERFERLLEEQGVITGIGSSGGASGELQFQELMGTQGLKKFLALLQECADSDVGISMEMRDERALVLRGRSTLYNQAPRFTLDFSNGVVSAPFKPVDDDKLTENDVIVQRVDGAFSRSILEEGRMSIQDPPDGVGRYDVSKNLSLFSDDQTASLAGWYMHMGTFDGLRYTRLTVDLANERVYEMLPEILNTDLGDVIRITNLPNEYGPDDVDLIVRGYTEEIGPEAWKITFNCSPGETWTTASAVLDIYEDFEDSDFNIDITDGGDAPWQLDSSRVHTGSLAMASGSISDNETSEMTVAVPPSAEKIEFWYLTSSEAAGGGFDGDYLSVEVDGIEVLRAQGVQEDWEVFSYDVSSASTVKFIYSKDNSAFAGLDAVYIDDLRFRITSPYGANVDTNGSELSAAYDSNDTELLVNTTAEALYPWASSDVYPNDFPLDVRIGGEVMEVTSILPPLADKFSRVTASDWGTPDYGPVWQRGGGVASDYSTSGTEGVHTLTTVNVSRRSFIDWVEPDVDMYVDVAVSAIATGGSLFGGPTLRHTSGDNLYMARVDFNTSSQVVLTLRERVAGVEAVLDTYTTNMSYSANVPVRVRFQVKGSELKAKIWRASDLEPKQWQAEATDTSLTASPFVGLRSIASSSNTNVNPQVKYDNYVMVSPQEFTVVRSQNGVVKSHTAGTDVRLAKTPIVPL